MPVKSVFSYLHMNPLPKSLPLKGEGLSAFVNCPSPFPLWGKGSGIGGKRDNKRSTWERLKPHLYRHRVTVYYPTQNGGTQVPPYGKTFLRQLCQFAI